MPTKDQTSRVLFVIGGLVAIVSPFAAALVTHGMNTANVRNALDAAERSENSVAVLAGKFDRWIDTLQAGQLAAADRDAAQRERLAAAEAQLAGFQRELDLIRPLLDGLQDNFTGSQGSALREEFIQKIAEIEREQRTLRLEIGRMRASDLAHTNSHGSARENPE